MDPCPTVGLQAARMKRWGCVVGGRRRQDTFEVASASGKGIQFHNPFSFNVPGVVALPHPRPKPKAVRPKPQASTSV